MYNIPANSPRIDARTRKTKPGKVNLYIYAITVSSEAIMKLPLVFETYERSLCRDKETGLS